jgi:hypothetical protein
MHQLRRTIPAIGYCGGESPTATTQQVKHVIAIGPDFILRQTLKAFFHSESRQKSL